MTENSPKHSPSSKNQTSSPEPLADPSLFSLLTLSLGNAALVGLGMVDDPSASPGQKREVNLQAARQNIDLLEMLEIKTKGNLTREEVQVLQGLLFDLRMKVVEAQKRS